MPSALEVQSLNHWTAREVPVSEIFIEIIVALHVIMRNNTEICVTFTHCPSMVTFCKPGI